MTDQPKEPDMDTTKTDPKVLARLEEACASAGDVAPVILRERLARASRSGLPLPGI